MPGNVRVDDVVALARAESEFFGWMKKKGGARRNWKERWFLLHNCFLYYLKEPMSNIPQGIINLRLSECEEFDDLKKRPNMFRLRTVKAMTLKPKAKKKSEGRVFYFIAPSADEMRDWIAALKKAAKKPQSLAGITRRGSDSEFTKSSNDASKRFFQDVNDPEMDPELDGTKKSGEEDKGDGSEAQEEEQSFEKSISTDEDAASSEEMMTTSGSGFMRSSARNSQESIGTLPRRKPSSKLKEDADESPHIQDTK